ncbi:Os11g0559600 [Oryza sativa Japonica Group]|uniref:Os11g0559600 protein n=1 Tax=Oryza sativa subsp. japonica TaxID=39947 RepID=A0A0P0Y3N0_ORYSJ|nr:hypothetical protein EE612_056166 [Oryza sativa]BAT14475.1 Os11g0559600 [Oryza sativa Japonica Group]
MTPLLLGRSHLTLSSSSPVYLSLSVFQAFSNQHIYASHHVIVELRPESCMASLARAEGTDEGHGGENHRRLALTAAPPTQPRRSRRTGSALQ